MTDDLPDTLVERVDLSFDSHGTRCAAWAYRPTAPGRDALPVVVMAHGLGAVRTMRLDAYARRFAEAGYLAVAFDYRHFGDSDGFPRGLLDIRRQREDYAAAIAWASTLPDADPRRVVAWGTSFSGGHVLAVAADSGLAAVIAQCPFTDGLASTLALGLRSGLKAALAAARDLLAAQCGQPPVYIPVAGPPGAAALMTAPDAEPGYRGLGVPDADQVPEVTARFGLRVPLDRPGRYAARITCPVLVCVCDHDSVAPASATLRAVRHASRVEVRRYPVGHFEIYLGKPFEQAMADQLAFLRCHVPVNDPH
jgi:dienelactone hydrolase